MRPQIANVAVVKTVEVDLGALQAIVPPDRACIPLDEFKEPLDDRFLNRIARRTTVRVGADRVVAGRFVKKIEKACGKVLEAFVAQGPNRRPFGLR